MTPESFEPLATTPEEIGELFERYRVALGDARLAEQSVDGRYVDVRDRGLRKRATVFIVSGEILIGDTAIQLALPGGRHGARTIRYL